MFVASTYVPVFATPDPYIKVTNELLGCSDTAYCYLSYEEYGSGTYYKTINDVYLYTRQPDGTIKDKILISETINIDSDANDKWLSYKKIYREIDIDSYLHQMGLKKIQPSNWMVRNPFDIILDQKGMHIRRRDSPYMKIPVLEETILQKYFSYKLKSFDQKRDSNLKYMDLFCDDDVGRVQTCYESDTWLFLYIEFPYCDHTPDVRGIIPVQKVLLRKSEKKFK